MLERTSWDQAEDGLQRNPQLCLKFFSFLIPGPPLPGRFFLPDTFPQEITGTRILVLGSASRNATEDLLLCLLEHIYQGSISRKIYRKKAKLSSYSLSSCLPFLGVLTDRGLMRNQFCHLPEHFNVCVCICVCTCACLKIN